VNVNTYVNVFVIVNMWLYMNSVYMCMQSVFFCKCQKFKKNRIFFQFLKFVMSDGLASAVGHNSLLCPTA
jgi:hypothetical protein